jgi:ATP-dependent Clp protease ATP-binding subunit ClpA
VTDLLSAIPRPIPPRAQAALRRAADLARSTRQAEVLPQHVMLGILSGPGVAVEAFDRLGVSTEALATAVQAGLPPAGDPAETDRPLSSQTRQLLDRALAEADRRGHPYVGTEHIVVVMTEDPAFEALLTAQGVSGEQVRDAITAELVKYGR